MAENKYILVNNDNKYNPENYENLDMVTIKIPVWNDNELVEGDVVYTDENGKRWVETFIEKSTYDNFLKLQQLAREKFGLEIEIIEAGRTLAKQAKYFQNAVDAKGQEYADNYVAKPGFSEHHTGYALDYSLRMPRVRNIKNPKLKNIVYKVKKPIAFAMVNNEAAKLGLVLRYPKFGKRYTGYNHERWHLSNVGDPVLASYLRTHNMPLEYFYANASKLANSYERFAESFTKRHPELVASEDADEMGE